MKYDSHLELFLHRGMLLETPEEKRNGKISINNLTVELFQDYSLMPNEHFHEGDTVFFFMIPTKFLVDDITGYGNYSAINVSRFRRRVFLNNYVTYRPCTSGTTIPPIEHKLADKTSNFYNYTLSEFNQLVITEAPIKIKPFSLVDEKDDLRLIKCPYNQEIKMACREFNSVLPNVWE